MGVVVGLDTHRGAGQSGADQVGDTFGGDGSGIHEREFSGPGGIIPA